jgi:uncharacterized repeat protein (TIGR01451 family)
VPGGLADGTVIANTSTVTSRTPQVPDVLPNTDTASVRVGAARITVVKDAKGQPGTFVFSLTGQPNSPPIADGGRYSWTVKPDATYTLAEIVPAGFRVAGITCSNQAIPGATSVDLTVVAGDDVTCTFANETFDLAIDKDDGGITAVAGRSFTYSLTVTNVGTSPTVGDATVVDDLPVEFRWGTTQPGGCTVAGQRLTCVIPAAELGVGGKAVRVVNVDVPPGTPAGTYLNRVYVDHPDDPYVPAAALRLGAAIGNPANNVDTEPTPVVAIADLGIVKDVEPAQVFEGSNTNFTLTITNNGPSTAVNVRLTDTLPAGLTVVSVASDGVFTCTSSPLVCTAASLAPAQVAKVTVVARVSPTGMTDGQQLRNVATVTSDTPDPTPDPTPNTDDAVVTVRVVPPLPPTGADPARPIRLGVELVLAGGLALLIARWRRREVAGGS